MLRLVSAFDCHGASIPRAQPWSKSSNPRPRHEVIPVQLPQPRDTVWGAGTPKCALLAQIPGGTRCCGLLLLAPGGAAFLPGFAWFSVQTRR